MAIWFDLPDKLSIRFIGYKYAFLYMKLITLSGFVSWRTDISVSFICGVVTHLVWILQSLVGVLFCPVCIIGVDIPLAMIFVVLQSASRLAV